jgi:hydroxymethylglutaryl-CoA reductase (NADPH)
MTSKRNDEKNIDDPLLGELLSGRKKAHNLEKDIFSGADNPAELAAGARRKYLEAKYQSPLRHISHTSIDYEDAGKRNIENIIGAVQVPLSYVELEIDGQYAKKGTTHVVYMATTEGKLVAGASRGAAAVNSGGVRTRILNEGMTRSDIVETRGIEDSVRISEFIKSESGIELIRSTFDENSKHCKFSKVETFATGRLLFIRYAAKTKAAMGMNMVTISSTATTRKIVNIMAKKGVWCRFASESGNLDSDKKPSMVNVLMGRGISVVAETVVPRDVVRSVLKSDPERIVAINYAKNYVGSGLAGSISHNAHIANALAAAFIAYGQDPAQIVDGVTSFDDACTTEKGDLYFSVYIPALELGTYGGGTRRETAMELLKSSGAYGEGDDEGITKLKLAELIASLCLASELNVLAAEAEGALASSHASLGRG